MASPNGTLTIPVAELKSIYDINDPVHEFVMPEPLVAAAAALAAPTTPVAPAQPVAGTPVGPRPTEPAPSAAHAAPASAAPAARHPEWLLREAAELGLHPLVLERFETPELTQYVMGEMRKVRDNSRGNQVAAAVMGQSAPVSAAVPAAPTSQPGQAAHSPSANASPAFDWGIHDDVDDLGRPVKKQFTDDMISPALVYHIKQQASRIEALEKHLSHMAHQAASAGQSQVDRQFDAAFNKLGGVFGTGTALALQGKPELQNRLLVYNAVKAMFSSLPAAVRDQMGIEKAVNTFARSMFNVEAPAAAAGGNGNGTPTPESFRTGGLGTPTQRQANDNPHGRDKAVEDANRWWKENQASGAIPAGGGTTMDEFFPM